MENNRNNNFIKYFLLSLFILIITIFLSCDLNLSLHAIEAVTTVEGNINRAPIETDIKVHFSEEMSITSVEEAFVLYCDKEIIQGVFIWEENNTVMTFNPDINLQYNTEYTVEISSTASSLSGISLNQKLFFTFKTISEWYIYTEKAIILFLNENSEQADVCTFASIMYAIGLIYGWDQPDVYKYLDKIISLRNPDGGYGLNKEWDAFSDGTINPPDTTYIITTDYLVGIPLLEAFKAGIVSEEDIYSLIDLLLSAPFGDNEKPGICIAYSFHPNDQVGCVHNVNASVGYFFSKAIEYGFKRDKMNEYINLITQREVYSYLPDEKGWYYWEGSSVIEPRMNDPNHAAASAVFMRPMAPTIAHEAGKHVLDNIINDEYALIGYLGLLPYFTEYSDQLLIMYKTYIDNKNFTTLRRLSEIIKYGAIITSCGL